MKKFLRNLALVFFSIVCALLIAEGISRVLFDPIDFLKPKRVPDSVLRYRIEPGTGAHDTLGFRNSYVPETADIVAIGDSHTYGISATASDSWPSQLERLTGHNVYNLSLGGYGPAEYLYLIEQYAFRFNPKIIIAGFYLGNDLIDSVRAVYAVPMWEELRKPGSAFLKDGGEKEDEKFSYGLGDFLSGHSVLYRLVSSSFVGDSLRQRRRLKRGQEIVMYENKDNGINTGFTPDQRLQALDLANAEAREGLRLSLEFLRRMSEIARNNNTEFLVVIIPTKESVFKDYIEGNKTLPLSGQIDELIENERKVNKIAADFFRENGIDYIDVLEPLSNRAGKEQLYPNNFGGHTNKNGYRIIAESIRNYLENN